LKIIITHVKEKKNLKNFAFNILFINFFTSLNAKKIYLAIFFKKPMNSNDKGTKYLLGVCLDWKKKLKERK
jgi:hypothetical protein